MPEDSTGDTIFKIQEAIAAGLSLFIISEISVTFRTSYSQDYDVVKCYYLIVFAAIAAVFFHSSWSEHFLIDYLWALTQYLETIAILGQLVLFVKKVTVIAIEGGINRDIYIPFCCFPSDIPALIYCILALVLYRFA